MQQGFSVRCAAILFDLDGVLVDSAACVERTWRRWAERHGLDPRVVLAEAHGRRTIETVKRVAPHLAAPHEITALEESESRTSEGIFEVPGARELLVSLPESSWAVVTSGIRAVATFRIQHTGLPMPRALVCADEITRGKPDPEGYLTAAERLGVPPEECVVIEDTPAGLEAGRAAGMRTIGISGTYPATALRSANHVVARLNVLSVVCTTGRQPIEISGHPA
jgi:sugar-phosphatase